FQAEDGIRDLTVTRVQTCALPIYLSSLRPWRTPTGLDLVIQSVGFEQDWLGYLWPVDLEEFKVPASGNVEQSPRGEHRNPFYARSEERRVGKECRSRMARKRVRKK